MAKYVSFIILVAIILGCGIVFFRVIAGFLLPLFLASLLAVIFRPLHAWMEHRLKNRPTLAAAATTSVILLIVLGPLAGVLTVAIHEGNQVLDADTVQKVKNLAVDKLRRLGLLKPFNDHLNAIEGSLRALDQHLVTPAPAANVADPFVAARRQVGRIQRNVAELWHDIRTVAESPSDDDARRPMFPVLLEHLKFGLAPSADGPPPYPHLQRLDHVPRRQLSDGELEPRTTADAQADALEAAGPSSKAIPPNKRSAPAAEQDAATPVDPWLIEKAYFERMKDHETLKHPFAECLSSLESLCGSLERLENTLATEAPNELDWEVASDALIKAQSSYANFRVNLFGGPIRTLVIDFVNPGEQLDQLQRKAADYLRRWLPSITSQATAVAGSLLMGLAIMTVTLFYFLKDGAALIRAAMQLSPLDDRHERQLLQAFDSMSRAVVVATLLSAIAQGVLGGIGYAIVGVESVFFLMMLTTIMAMVPFVGAAAVWVPTAIWLALVDERLGAAAFLAIYGVLVVSMADNFIKPWVLQGQSNLHPLLGLLSVLGGVQALGPIGILVGPMVVSLLQVLLQLLQLEIESIDEQLAAAAVVGTEASTDLAGHTARPASSSDSSTMAKSSPPAAAATAPSKKLRRRRK